MRERWWSAADDESSGRVPRSPGNRLSLGGAVSARSRDIRAGCNPQTGGVRSLASGFGDATQGPSEPRAAFKASRVLVFS